MDHLLSNDIGENQAYKQRPTQLKLTHKIPDIAVFSQNESISTIDNNKEMSAQHSSIRQFENSRRSLKGLIKKNSRKLPYQSGKTGSPFNRSFDLEESRKIQDNKIIWIDSAQ